jgi:hypothetical protein
MTHALKAVAAFLFLTLLTVSCAVSRPTLPAGGCSTASQLIVQLIQVKSNCSDCPCVEGCVVGLRRPSIPAGGCSMLLGALCTNTKIAAAVAAVAYLDDCVVCCVAAHVASWRLQPCI